MRKLGFDNNKYLAMQSDHIRERISQFGDKLYLEFGGKLFDDYHASRVLPGFEPDSKLRMLMQLSDQADPRHPGWRGTRPGAGMWLVLCYRRGRLFPVRLRG